MATPKSMIPPHGGIHDIGGSTMSPGILKRLREALLGKDGAHEGTTNSGKSVSETIGKHDDMSAKGIAVPTLPDELLYDDVGLSIWAEIIFTPTFYQTHDEMAIFKSQSAEIAKYIPEDAIMIDLGAGDLRKVEYLLTEMEKRPGPSTYLALDISKASLAENIEMLASKHARVTVGGLWGDFGHGLNYVAKLTEARPRAFLSLGSVLFNDNLDAALTGLKSWAALLRPEDVVLAGMDGHSLRDHRHKIWAAYHTRDDLFARFWANGFAHANRLLREEWFRSEDWDPRAEMDDEGSRHRFFFRAKRDVVLGSSGKVLPAGQEMEWFDSHKHDEEVVKRMCAKAGLVVVNTWKAPGSEMCQYLLHKDLKEGSPSEIDSAISDMQ